jgi:DNA-binding NarL/FixJ family response regulator
VAEKIPVGLIEQNPLAVPYLQHLLQRGHIRVYSDGALLTRADSSKKPIAVFVVDAGTLLIPLHTCIHQIQERWATSKILLVGDKLSHHQMILLMEQGVQGFVRYSEVKKRIVSAIHTIVDDKLWFPSEIVEQLAADVKTSRTRWASVTRRERRIIGLLEQRLSNKQAAAALNVSENTIKFHLSNIFRKLDVHDRKSAVVVSISRRLGGHVEAAMDRATFAKPQTRARPEPRARMRSA